MKKKFKKLIAFFLAMVMCLGMTVTAFAEGELTDEQMNQVTAVKEMLENIPTLQEMQNARGTAYKLANFGSAQEAADAYDVYIAEKFASRTAAQEAYDALSEEQKQFIDSELVAKLTDTLEISFKQNVKVNNVVEGTDGYVWQLLGGTRYIRSPHYHQRMHYDPSEVDTEGKTFQSQPFILYDTSSYAGKTWVMDPDREYEVGVSNYELAYCCDQDTSANNGTYYKRVNLEDSEYYTEGTAEHIRAIVMNSYPFVSVEEMKENLIELGMDEAFVASLDRSDLIAAAQWAVWYYANFDVPNAPHEERDHLTQYMDTYPGHVGSTVFVDYTNELWYWWDTSGSNESYINTAAKNKVETLSEFLIGLDSVALSDDQIVIDSLELAGEPVLIDVDDTYKVLLKVTLNNSGSGEQDSLSITVTAGESDITIPVVHGTTEYAVSITAKSGDEIKAEVEGAQVLPEGVYFYIPKPADKDKDGIATSREASQNMVGVAVGETPVYAMDSLTFEITDVPDSASIGLQKIGEEGEPLAGAEFTLAYDVDGDGDAEPIKTYEVNENGFLQIDNLIAGQTYVLNETVAPEGYYRLTQNIEFTVTTNGITADNLPAGVALTEKNGLAVLTVENVKTPSILSITKSTVIGDGNDVKPLEGITFDIYYVGSVDDYTDYVEEVAKTYGGAPEDFQVAVQEKFAAAKAAEVAAGTLTPVETVTTDPTGKAVYNVTLDGQPDGIFLLIEREHPAIVAPLAPFIVTVPMTNENGTGLDYLVEIHPKNEVLPGPEVEKNVTEIGTDLDSFDVGETHTWILRGGVPVDIANGKQYVMTDVLDYRLDYQGNVKVVVGTSNLLAGEETITLTADEDYTLTTGTSTDDAGNTVDTFTVKLTAEGMTKVAEAVTVNTVDANEDNKVNYKDMEIRVYFDSVITQGAVVGTEIPNEVTLDYLNSVGIDFKDEDDAKVYTCGINIKKYDAKETTKYLAGAEFKVARKATAEEIADETIKTETRVIGRGETAEVVYVDFYNNKALVGDKVKTVVTDDNGAATIYGLAEIFEADPEDEEQDGDGIKTADYYLVETKAPEGYNLLSYPIKVKLNEVSHTDANILGVANSNRFELPSTGGIGTTIFTLVGAALTVGSGAVLVGKKRKEEE